MASDGKTYLLRAAAILKTFSNPIIAPVVLGLLFVMPTSSEGPAAFLFFLPIIVFFVLIPLIYGQYIEIITNNRQLPYLQVFNTHWFNFFVVSIWLAIPVVILIILGQIYPFQFLEINFLAVVIDILSIYILPLVFLLKKRLACIPLGVKCLFGNFSFSIPLVALAAVPSILHMFTIEFSEISLATLPYLAINYILWIISLIIDFVVFIAAGLILKEKLLPS